MRFAPPATEAELLARARALAGTTVGEAAAQCGRPMPDSTLRGKGFVGALVESLLGASAGSRAEPDFPELGIELKTVPISAAGKVLESTFVATVPLPELARLDFDASPIGKKLARVLFVPVEGRPVVLHARRFGAPLLYAPTDMERRTFEDDYEIFSRHVADGRLDELTAHLGTALQVRPKGRRGGDRTVTVDDSGELRSEQPRGVYLRAPFVERLFRIAAQ